MKENYQIILDKTIKDIQAAGKTPSLLLHACCAPCSSYVLEYLSGIFDITIFYYNPNISPASEFNHRVNELKRLISEMPLKREVRFIEGEYDPESFTEISRGLEDLPEGGERCFKCYELRMSRAAEEAKRLGADFFTTTLSISPHKNAQKLNEIGEQLAAKLPGIYYLNSDFKKKDGYKRSIELSRIYGLYRQDYCGCIFSRQERERIKQEKKDAVSDGFAG